MPKYDKTLIEHIETTDRMGGADSDGNLLATHDTGGFTAGNVPMYDSDGLLTDSGESPGGGGGGGGSWSLAESWEHSVAGNTASPIDFSNLGSLTDIMVVVEGLTTSANGQRFLVVSTNNGSSFYLTSGDYAAMANGSQSDTTVMARSSTTSNTSAQAFLAVILGAGVNGGYKVNRGEPWDTVSWLFKASTSPINAVRVLNGGVPGGGNFTGGKIFVFVR